MTLRVLVKTIINGLLQGVSWRKETLKTGGQVCYSIWYVHKIRTVCLPYPDCHLATGKKGKWRRKNETFILIRTS